MRELSPLSASSPAALSQTGGRARDDSGFAELLSAAPQGPGAHAPHSPEATSAAPPAGTGPRPPQQARMPNQPGTDEGPQAQPTGLPRPLREGLAASLRKPRLDTAQEESEGKTSGDGKGRKGRQGPRTAHDGLLGIPAFSPTPQPVRAAQSASAAQLKSPSAAAATKVTARANGREPADAKPSAPETGDLPSHRPGATPSAPQPQAASAGATSVAELAAPPPVLPAPLVQAALDLPALHLSILPHSARLSVSTDEGDVRVQLRVKDSVANVRVEGPGAAAFQRAPDELRVTLAQAGLSLGSFELSHGEGQQRHERQEPVVPFEPEVASAGFVTRRAADSGGTEGEKAHPRQVRVRA